MKSNKELNYLAATDEAFGTVIGPQQVAVRILPHAYVAMSQINNPSLVPGRRQQYEGGPYRDLFHPVMPSQTHPFVVNHKY